MHLVLLDVCSLGMHFTGELLVLSAGSLLPGDCTARSGNRREGPHHVHQLLKVDLEQVRPDVSCKDPRLPSVDMQKIRVSFVEHGENPASLRDGRCYHGAARARWALHRCQLLFLLFLSLLQDPGDSQQRMPSWMS